MERVMIAWMFVIFGFSSFTQSPVRVYVFAAEECPVCISISNSLANLAAKYQEQVDFYLVFPLKRSHYKSIHLFKEKYNLTNYESILDNQQILTDQLGATVTPEAIILNQQDSVLYQGRVNNEFFAPGKRRSNGIVQDLDVAISYALKGQKMPTPWEPPIGCYITKYSH